MNKLHKWIEYHKWKFKGKTYTPLMDPIAHTKCLVLMTRTEFGLLGHYNEYKNIDVYQDGSCYKSFVGNEERQERVPLLFFLYVGFFFFCERAVELFFEIFGPLG